MSNYKVVDVDWNELYRLSRNILIQIKEKNINIDTLVPIIRGGMPLALMLASNLENVETACLHLRRSKTNKANSEFGETILKGITNSEAIRNKDILIVEDIVDKGLTLDTALQVIEKYHPKNVYIASFYNYNKEKYKKIISGKIMDEIVWISFPWEKVVEKYED